MSSSAHHPAQKLYLIAIILLVVTVLFGFISVFVPWAMKDIAIGQRAWAYPFKTCIEDTFSIINQETCMDNDFIEPTGVPLTGGSAFCKGMILAIIAMVFLSVLIGVVCLILMYFVVDGLYSRPVMLASIVQALLFIIMVTAILAWIFFIVYAEKTCAPNSIFPVHGYSYGFILYIFGSTAAIGAFICAFLGLKKIKSFVPEKPADEQPMITYPEYPVYDHADQAPSPTPASVP